MGWSPMLFLFDDGLVMHGGMQTTSDVVRTAICVAPCQIDATERSRYHQHPECSCEGEHVVAWWEPDEGWDGSACRAHGQFNGPSEPYGYDGGYSPEGAIPPPKMFPMDPAKWEAHWATIKAAYDAQRANGSTP